MLDVLTLQEEKRELQTKISTNPDNPDVPVLRAMLTSTNMQIAAHTRSQPKQTQPTQSGEKVVSLPKARLVSSNGGKRYRVRRVKKKLAPMITPKDFRFIDRVNVQLFNKEEWVVDLASLERPYDQVMAVRMAPSWKVVPFIELYYEVRNIRTFKNKVIAKRKNQGHELRYQEGYCPKSLGL